MKIEIRRARRAWPRKTRGRFYAVIVAANGAVLFTSETYDFKRDAEHAALLVADPLRHITVEDLT